MSLDQLVDRLYRNDEKAVAAAATDSSQENRQRKLADNNGGRTNCLPGSLFDWLFPCVFYRPGRDAERTNLFQFSLVFSSWSVCQWAARAHFDSSFLSSSNGSQDLSRCCRHPFFIVIFYPSHESGRLASQLRSRLVRYSGAERMCVLPGA